MTTANTPRVRSKLPVLVVGNGPVGLLTALALGKLNVPVIIITRHMRRLGVPKAHALSPRSLEICRQLDIPIKVIRERPAHRVDARWIRFMTTCDGELVHTLPYENMELSSLDMTPEMVHNVAQPDLEYFIEKEMDKQECVDYRTGWTWVSFEEVTRKIGDTDEEETICISTLEDTHTGEEVQVESCLVVGADGANSRVRRFCEITSEGEEAADTTMVTIHFKANLRPIVKDRTAMLYWIMDPQARGFIISYDIEDNHVLIHNIDPVLTPLSTFTPDKCERLVRTAIGKIRERDGTQTEPDVDFLSSMPWILRRQVAHQYYKGLAVLAGDSAHSFPPTGGLGLNSGVGDAHNLAFKVASAYHGWASMPAVLATYESERRPVAVANSIQSVHNGRGIFRLLKALGERGTFEEARASMHATLRDPNKLPYIKALIDDQITHFDNINRHLGYVYEPGWVQEKTRIFTPAYRRGARLAHAWIKPKVHKEQTEFLVTVEPVWLGYLPDLGSKQRAAWKYSTLDCIPHGVYTFFYSSSKWRKNVSTLVALFKRHNVPFKAIEVGKDFEFVERKPGKAWIEGYGLKSNGLLVRPDQHIAAIAPPPTKPAVLQDLIDGVRKEHQSP